MKEADLIGKYLAPLATKEAPAYALRDDAAHFPCHAKQNLVITTDTMVEGVHFFGGDQASDIARKLLRVSLSDLAAKGANPLGYTLNLALSDKVSEKWIQDFTAGLAADQKQFSFHLWGGDSTTTQGPHVLSATLFGEGPDQPILRANARAGDLVYCTGTIGDAALALLDYTRGNQPDKSMELRRTLPEPRLGMGTVLREFAHAAIDVSDGLVIDCERIARASGLCAIINASDIPLSETASKRVVENPEILKKLITGGDDYEIIFTVAPSDSKSIERLAQEAGISVQQIGHIEKGQGIRVLDKAGHLLAFQESGFQHNWESKKDG